MQEDNGGPARTADEGPDGVDKDKVSGRRDELISDCRTTKNSRVRSKDKQTQPRNAPSSKRWISAT